MDIAWTKAALALMPRIITRRSAIEAVPRRFIEQYPDRTRVSHTGETYGELHDALAALDLKTCDRSAVDDIIGNDSWTSLCCEVCDMDRDTIVCVPREYEQSVSICGQCAEGVLSVLRDAA